MIVTDRPGPVAQWAGRRLGCRFVPPLEAWAVIGPDGITGAVVFNDYEARNIEVTVVGTGWSRKVLRQIADYVFNQLQCNRASFTTRASNAAVRGFIERLGARQEGIRRAYYADDDAVIFGLLRDEFRFW